MAGYGTDLLWGFPQMSFKATPPFNEMRQGFATFKKETHMAPTPSRTYRELTKVQPNLQKLK
jgi:hypothetical protein